MYYCVHCTYFYGAKLLVLYARWRQLPNQSTDSEHVRDGSSGTVVLIATEAMQGKVFPLTQSFSVSIQQIFQAE